MWIVNNCEVLNKISVYDVTRNMTTNTSVDWGKHKFIFVCKMDCLFLHLDRKHIKYNCFHDIEHSLTVWIPSYICVNSVGEHIDGDVWHIIEHRNTNVDFGKYHIVVDFDNKAIHSKAKQKFDNYWLRKKTEAEVIRDQWTQKVFAKEKATQELNCVWENLIKELNQVLEKYNITFGVNTDDYDFDYVLFHNHKETQCDVDDLVHDLKRFE